MWWRGCPVREGRADNHVPEQHIGCDTHAALKANRCCSALERSRTADEHPTLWRGGSQGRRTTRASLGQEQGPRCGIEVRDVQFKSPPVQGWRARHCSTAVSWASANVSVSAGGIWRQDAQQEILAREAAQQEEHPRRLQARDRRDTVAWLW